MEPRIAEGIALAVILLSTLQGASKGLVRKVYSLVRLLLLLVVTLVLTQLILPVMPSDLQAREGIALLVALIATAIILNVVEHVLKIIDHIPVVSTVNKLGGAVLGFVIGVLLVWIILLLMGAMQEAEWCRRASEIVRQSPVLMQIQQFNPLPIIMENFDFPVL